MVTADTSSLKPESRARWTGEQVENGHRDVLTIHSHRGLTCVQPRLAIALLFINVGRELADDSPESSWAEDRHSAFLLASARLYHAQESRMESSPEPD